MPGRSLLGSRAWGDRRNAAERALVVHAVPAPHATRLARLPALARPPTRATHGLHQVRDSDPPANPRTAFDAFLGPLPHTPRRPPPPLTDNPRLVAVRRHPPTGDPTRSNPQPIRHSRPGLPPAYPRSMWHACPFLSCGLDGPRPRPIEKNHHRLSLKHIQVDRHPLAELAARLGFA